MTDRSTAPARRRRPFRRPAGRGARTFAAIAALILPGCAALDPKPVTVDQRIAAFPTSGLDLERPVTLRWSDEQVPFIEAETDRDLAYTLGLVHAHLRLAQISLMKRVSQGRLSEMGGPVANDIDHALRILGFGRGSAETARALAPETRIWVEAFVKGLNDYQDRLAKAGGPWPPEFGLLGIRAEPWTVEDVLTIGRLAGTDVNWLAWAGLLRERARNGPQDPRWRETWARATDAGHGSVVSFPTNETHARLERLLTELAGLSRTGSNSVAVSGRMTETGSAIIANDPHLGMSLPNFWLLAGMRSPSYQAVGMMPPGLPFVAVGRSPYLAWGGTNMRALSSELYDVSALPADAFRTETHTIRTRFWFDRTVTVRVSPYGPVVSDSELIPSRPGEAIALRWLGHDVSDEIGALLGAMRARDGDEFRAAFAGRYAVSAQNMLWADTEGHVGQVLAARLPVRPDGIPQDLVARAGDPDRDWARFVDAGNLPAARNPAAGFLASANNRPTDTDRLVPIGLFFSADERVRRLQNVVRDTAPVSVDDLKQLQQDVTSDFAEGLAAMLAAAARDAGVAGSHRSLELITGWDGAYAADAAAPVAFEVLLSRVAAGVYGGGEATDGRFAFASSWTQLNRYLAADLARLPEAERRRILEDSLAAADAALDDYPAWGDMHRLRLSHLLGQAPVIGGFFTYGDWPVGGSRETPMKTAHDLVEELHAARYGAQSRHVSDMGDPDANWFVLLGGQDGWLGSSTFADQVPLWRGGDYLKLPLTPPAVAERFPRRLDLTPDQS
jgi:penicillin amidase